MRGFFTAVFALSTTISTAQTYPHSRVSKTRDEGAQHAAGQTASSTTLIRSELKQEVAKGFAGSVLLARYGRVLLNEGFGVEKGVPVRANSRFWIASAAKQYWLYSPAVTFTKRQAILETPLPVWLRRSECHSVACSRRVTALREQGTYIPALTSAMGKLGRITSDWPVIFRSRQRQKEKVRSAEREQHALREDPFIENGFVARVRAVGVVYWSALHR
jgi:hypothetical protein